MRQHTVCQIKARYNVRRQAPPDIPEKCNIGRLEGGQEDRSIFEDHETPRPSPWHQPKGRLLRLHRRFASGSPRWKINGRIHDHLCRCARCLEQRQTVHRRAINLKSRIHGVRQGHKGSPDWKISKALTTKWASRSALLEILNLVRVTYGKIVAGTSKLY